MKTTGAGSSISDRARGALLIAAVAGSVHGAFSLYWGVGDTWLLETLGTALVQTFSSVRWVLVPLAIAKVGFALLPLWLASRGTLTSRPATAVCGLGAGVLIVWGGLNTVVGNLVLAGVVQPTGGYDRRGMIGHAWLWDPLFLLWGAGLSTGLVLIHRDARIGRRARSSPTSGR